MLRTGDYLKNGMIIEDDSLLMTLIERIQDVCGRTTVITVGGSSFRLTPSAKKRILLMVSFAKDSPLENCVPCLMHSFGFKTSDQTGSVFNQYSGSHFSIGFDHLEQMKDRVAFEIEGVTLFATPETGRALDGKRLVVKRVAAGYPDPKSQWHRLLLAE
jgi:hypothetical protein